jgi:hypothetical protein
MISLDNLENVILERNKQYHFDAGYFKRYSLLLLCSIVKNNSSQGTTVEIGSGNGETSVYIRNLFDSNYTHHIFDSFEGLSEPSQEDAIDNEHVRKGNLACGLDVIKMRMESNCSNNNIIYHKGWVNDTIPHELPDDICFAHVDLDLYEPTYHSLKHIIPRMQNNGIIIVDDYEDPVWIGCKPACELIEKEFNVKFTRINLPGSEFYQGVLQIRK